MPTQERYPQETLRVEGGQLVEEVKRLLHEGNVRRLIIRHEGHAVLEIPVTLGVLGAVFLPTLAAVGAMAALLSDCTIEVVREGDENER